MNILNAKCVNKFHEETAPAKEGEACPTCKYVPSPKPTLERNANVALLIARALKEKEARLSIRHPAPPSAVEVELMQVSPEDRAKWQGLLEKAAKIELGLFELRALRSLTEGQPPPPLDQSRPEVFPELKRKKLIRTFKVQPDVSEWRIEDLGRAMLAVHIMKDDAEAHVRCRHAWHQATLPILVDACPDCDAMPSFSVKRGGAQPVEAEGSDPKRLLEQAKQLEICDIKLNLLRWVADGENQWVHAQHLYEELQELRLVYIHESLVKAWRLTELGLTVLLMHTPPARRKCDQPWHRNPALIFPCPECGCQPGTFSRSIVIDPSQGEASLADWMQAVVDTNGKKHMIQILPGYRVDHEESDAEKMVLKPKEEGDPNLYRSITYRLPAKKTEAEPCGTRDGAETLMAEDRFAEIQDAVYGGALDCEHPELRNDMVWLVEQVQLLTRSIQRKDPTMWSTLDGEYLKVQKERDSALARVTNLEAVINFQRAERAQLNIELATMLKVIPEQDKRDGETDSRFWVRAVGEALGTDKALLIDALAALVAMQRDGVMMREVLPRIRGRLGLGLPETDG